MTHIAAILVGGKGTRLRSLVSDVPKPLANVAGEPFLFLMLRELASLGIQKVVLLTGYLHEQIVAACGDGKQFGLDIIYSEEKEPLGTAGALSYARRFLQDSPEFLLLNGDTHLTCSIEGLVKSPLRSSALGLIGIVKPDDAKRYGTVEINSENGDIVAFREKDEKSTGLVSAGIYKLSSSIFNFIPEGKASSLEQDIFPVLIANNHPIQSFFLDGILCDIGLPETYAAFSLERLLHTPNLTPFFRGLLAEVIINFDREYLYES
jgi:NDP-sugar pyrophosphorylase family protein